MDFTNIKAITIPEGSVKSLAHNGTALWRKSRLPEGYTEQDAIICFGGQWIDTGITMTSEDAMSIDLDISGLSEPTFLIMGARNGFENGNISFVKQGSGYGVTCDFNNGNGNAYRYMMQNWQSGRFKLFNSKYSRGVAGVGSNNTVNNDTFTAAGHCCVGFWGAGSNQNSIGVIGCIYEAEIAGKWHGIPCTRDADGEAGLYDIVGGRFCGNAGIGVMGVKYHIFVDGYKQLRAVEATGTQWFNLGFKAKDTMRYDINIRPTAQSSPDAQIWFGSYDGTVNFYMGPGGRLNWDIYFAPNLNNQTIPGTVSSYPLLKSCQGGPTTRSSTFYVFPNSKNINASAYTTALDIWMFNRNSVNGQYSNLPAKATFYLMKVTDGGNIFRRYVPALRESDNIAGILDMVTGTYYHSETGTELNAIYFS